MSKRWDKENDTHALYFSPYDDDEIKLAEIFCDADGGWCYSSEILHASEEYLGSDSLEEAKTDVECFIQEHYEGERDYYNELLNSFKEATHEPH